MNVEQQNAFLLNLLNRLYMELGVYLSFAEFVKLMVGSKDVEEILAKCRRDPNLQLQVESYVQALSAALPLGEEVDPDSAVRAFLLQWNGQQKPD